MPNSVIPDTSSLILFHKIGKLNLLNKIYDSIITTPEVVEEFLYEVPD